MIYFLATNSVFFNRNLLHVVCCDWVNICYVAQRHFLTGTLKFYAIKYSETNKSIQTKPFTLTDHF